MNKLTILVHLLLCTSVMAIKNSQDVEIYSNILDNAFTPIKDDDDDVDVMLWTDKFNEQNNKVKIQLYYECLCPGCRQFDTTSFIQVYHKLENYLEVHTYPYGDAETHMHVDGTIGFRCQHGENECYGNMLHACAIDILANVTSSIYFNACMMDPDNAESGSDDATADECSKLLNVDAGPIKECAKGKKGQDLLKFYGDESHKVKFNYVPFVLINGLEWDQDTESDFMKRVCREFKKPPPACTDTKIYY